MKRFQQVAPKSPKDMSKLRRRLATAGYRSLTAAVIYGAAETLLPFIVGGLALLFFGFSRWYFAVLAAALGFVLPSVWLGRVTALRQKQIRHGLPDALDLMIVCIEAGSGVDQAIMKTSDELDITHPALAEELRLVTTEMRAGKPRLEAFKNFASRTKVDDVRSLVSMLVQTDKIRHERGAGAADACRRRAHETSAGGGGTGGEDWRQTGVSTGVLSFPGAVPWRFWGRRSWITSTSSSRQPHRDPIDKG